MKAIAAFFVCLFFLNPANAQWLFQEQESAFSGDARRLAFAASGKYGMGFRCTGPDDTEVLYLTPDTSFDSDTYKLANVTKPLIKLRVDNGEVDEVEAKILDMDGKASFIADVEPSVLKKVIDAKKRIAIVVTLLGTNYHEQTFSVRGSTKAVNKLVKGCQIEGF